MSPSDVAPYLPGLLRDGSGPGSRPLTGTFVSADLSGFTRLSERLAGSGRLGAEVLSDAIDGCFTALIDALAPLGGEVLFFGGDALFVAFTGPGHAARAVGAASSMQRVLRDAGRITTPRGTVRLAMSVGVATGTAQLVVGDGPQRPWFLVGPTVTRTVRLEHEASAGQILLASATAREVPRARLRPVGDAWLVTRVPLDDLGAAPPPAPSVEPAGPGPLGGAAMHLPDALRERLLAGDVPREHRQLVAAFVRLPGLDRLGRSARERRLLEASEVVGEACRQLGVCWVATDVLADGAKVVLAAGLPQQSDEDELRLVAAGRRILASDVGAFVSIGMHRGTAFVGDIGHPARRTYTIMGDSVNIAARLMDKAPRGAMLAGDQVVSHLGDRYLTGPEQLLSVKGKQTSVRARTIGERVANPASRRDGAGPAGIVGRDPELTVLRQAWADCLAGRGQVIDLVAPPGMGKSHLVRALLAEMPAPALAVTGELALGVVPFGALVAPLQRLLELEGDAAAAAGRLGELAGELAPLVGPAVGLELEPTGASAAIEPRSVPGTRLDLISHLVEAAHPRSGWFVVEDAHWLDPASAAVLGGLAERVADRGWLVLVTRRPEMEPFTSVSSSIVLEPLDDRALRQLAIAASGDRALSDAVLHEVVGRAHGNALFLGQLVGAAVAGDEVALPESAERVIGARIDVLAATSRRRLRQASVLGLDADLDLLARVTGDDELRSGEAWRSLNDFVVVGDGQVRFRHDLFRLAAYEGLDFAERRRLHEATARHLARRAETPPAVLAEHFDRARRPDPAATWAARAAQEATQHAAFSDAARLWQVAVRNAKLAGRSPASRAEALVELGRAHEILAEPAEAEAAFQQALTLAPASERPAIRTRMAWVAFRDDRFSLAKRRITLALRELEPLAARRGAAGLRVELMVLRSAVRDLAGDLAGSAEDARWAEAEARRLRRDDLRGEALMQLALHADLAEEPEVEELADEARRLLERTGKRHEIGILDVNLGVTHMMRGRWPAALALFESAGQAFARSGGVLGATITDANRGGILTEQGHLREAVELYEDVMRRCRAAGHARMFLFARGSAARARAWSGAPGPAIVELTEAADALEAGGHRIEAGDVRSYHVEALLLDGRFDDARRLAGQLLDDLTDRSDEEVVMVTLHRLRALATHLAGGPGALDEVRAALDLARARDTSIEIARGLQALEELAPVVDPTWHEERVRRCEQLGVVWLPPLTFANLAAGGHLGRPPMVPPAPA